MKTVNFKKLHLFSKWQNCSNEEQCNGYSEKLLWGQVQILRGNNRYFVVMEWLCMLTVCACVHTKSLQWCLTLCDPKDCSPSGSSVYEILQARTLEWVAMVLRAAQLFLQLSVSLYFCFRFPMILYKLSVCMDICAQSCPILCDPVDHSLPGSSVHGILQARILVWVAMHSSRGPSWPRDQIHISYIVSCIADRFFTAEPPGKPILIIVVGFNQIKLLRTTHAQMNAASQWWKPSKVHSLDNSSVSMSVLWLPYSTTDT